jgi:ABC-type spermidine/putrescine transport system permease subunit II
VAVLWPVVRLLPLELRDAAQLDGARPGQRLRYLLVPLFGLSWGMAALAVAILSLGELSASKLASTPGAATFTHEVFIEMHYGVANNLAALCLLLLAVVTLGGALAATLAWLLGRSARSRKMNYIASKGVQVPAQPPACS